jgi:hypothetical protein
VHYVGKIKGASRFESRFQNLSLSWRLVVDEENGWSVLQGAKHGKTQIDSSWVSARCTLLNDCSSTNPQ